MKYLSEEEQYKEILNDAEIKRIKDDELREIRWKYWLLRHKAFVNEHDVPDSQLGIVYDEIAKKERAEIDKYKKALHDKV